MAKGSVSKNYDATTGKLTASVKAIGGYFTNNDSSFNGSTAVSFKLKAYLVIGTIN